MAEERLQKILARHGVASRRKAEELIRAGRVTVNSMVAWIGQKADPSRDEILLDGKPLPPPPEPLYFILYKPYGVITSVRDPKGRPTVMDFLKGIRQRLFPVGRLDWDSEGLVLITNDGQLAYRLTHPRFEVPRRYLVKVKGHPDQRVIRKVSEGGLLLEDGPSPKMEVRLIGKTARSTWLHLTLREGRNRVIRRTFELVGHPVRKLKRVGFGPLTVEGLKPGQIRPLTEGEIRELKRWVKLLD